jgi:hypothetical protein
MMVFVALHRYVDMCVLTNATFLIRMIRATNISWNRIATERPCDELGYYARDEKRRVAYIYSGDRMRCHSGDEAVWWQVSQPS